MNPLRIGTWNVDTAPQARLDALRAVLERHAADIWVLTETHDDLRPGEDYAAAHAELQDLAVAKRLRPGNRWVSIWSRFPIRQSLPVSDCQRTAAALIEAPTGPLIVFGTVLPWPGSSPGFASAIEQQSADWLALQRAHPDADICLAGDFNTDFNPSSVFPGKAGNNALTKALEVSGMTCISHPETFPHGLFSKPPIDHIALSSRLAARAEIVEAWEGDAGGRKLTDHSGFVVRATRS